MLRVSVQSLPRCDIFNFTDEILASKIDQLNAGHKDSKNVLEYTNTNGELFSSPLKKKSCINELETNNHLQTLNGNNLANKQNCVGITKPSTSRTLCEQVGRDCDQNLLISPKISRDGLKESIMNIRSLSEGTPGNLLQGQTKQYNLNKLQEPAHKLETKKVNLYSF